MPALAATAVAIIALIAIFVVLEHLRGTIYESGGTSAAKYAPPAGRPVSARLAQLIPGSWSQPEINFCNGYHRLSRRW